jgi:lysophospholipase L1-like esterase
LAQALAAGFIAAFVVGCAVTSTPSASPMPGGLRYVALGDSYTIGTSVAEASRFPDQLVERVPGIELVANLGVNGYSSAQLIDQELPQLDALDPDFVTVLIGVNDVVRGVPAERYRQNMNEIFDFLLARLPANRIVVVSTPDYTLTPAGASFGDPIQQRAAIAEFNAIEQELAETRGIAFVDISGIANQVPEDPELVAGDSLHPSGKQYSAWVALIAPVVEGVLAE